MGSEIIQTLGILIAFGSILFLAFIFTKLIAGKTKKTMQGRYISIVESINLGFDKQIHLLKVDDQFILVATAGKSVEFLTTLKLDNYIENENPTGIINNFDFKAIFEKYTQLYKDKKSGSTVSEKHNNNSAGNVYNQRQKNDKSYGEGEVFKGNLSRLKSMANNMYGQDGIDGDETTNEK